MEENKKSIFFIPMLILILPILIMFIVNINILKNSFNFVLQNSVLQSFTTIFLSIILEAFPFIIIGVFISSIIQMFVSEETIAKIIPKNKFIGLLAAASIGLIFPVCDCAIVPIARRLLKKGVPLYIAVTFMLSVPIINPVVLSSTYYAFLNDSHMAMLRGFIGWTSSILIGFIISILERKHNRISSLRNNSSNTRPLYYNFTLAKNDNCSHEHGYCCHHEHHHEHDNETNHIHTISHILEHVSSELNEVGKFIIAGAFLSALMQTIIPRRYILSIGSHKILSIVAMIALAYVMCVCSETDAFIAKTFVGQFTSGSIIAFLICGPMIDIKNTLMLSDVFNRKFIFKLTCIVMTVCFFIGIIFNFLNIVI
ncbi:permease [Clostridium hydrogenum]|uniref:permease n=1 Tax=Clostridium hydrogenum TaxID=2855764 RepID=UPI001F32077D|nr:permease [Clostridium hydrogenum]